MRCPPLTFRDDGSDSASRQLPRAYLLDAVRAGVIASCSSRVTRYARLAGRGPFQKEHAALYSLYGNESDLAEAVLLVARLTQAARFHTYIYNVMPPVLAAFLFLRA